MNYRMDTLEQDYSPALSFQSGLMQLMSALAADQDTASEEERAMAHSATASGNR